MSALVKICGLSTEAALTTALDHGADYVGFVFFPPSPRHVALDVGKRLCELARGKAKTVALAVDPDDALIADIVGTVQPDLIQLHGNETPARCAAVRSSSGCKVIKAIKVETREDVTAGLAWREAADLLLFDAKAPKGLVGALPGGNGLSFDWQILEGVSAQLPFMLSGGLTPENVSDAIRLTGAMAVDVSSGVERAPGQKDPALIKAFLAVAKAA